MSKNKQIDSAEALNEYIKKIQQHAPDGIFDRMIMLDAAKCEFAKAGFSHDQFMLISALVAMMDMMRMQDSERMLLSALQQLGVNAEIVERSTAH